MVYTVFIDLDDTLLNSEKRISDHTLDALQRFQSLGNHVVFATARSRQLHGLQDCVKTATPHFIFHNGGEIISGGETIYQGFFSEKATERIGRYLTENSIKAAVILDDAYYANYDAPSIWGNVRNYRFTSFENVDFRAPKFSVLLGDELQAAVLNALNNISDVTFIDRGAGAIIAPKNVSKGSAVRIMLNRLFPKGKSVFIGNDHNDLSGFAVCDIKAAVANAEPVLLEKADIVIGSNNDDGVARFLDELCRN
jgi:Cof subfamily protein (haloacid dehalogenase superfamily)